MTQPSSHEEAHSRSAFQFWLRFWRMVVAGVQILGGLVGCYLTVALLFSSSAVEARIIVVPFIVLYAAAILGGILLALNKASGVLNSFVVQGAQFVQVWTDGFVFSFICGLQLLIGITPSENGPSLQFLTGITSAFNLYFGSLPEEAPRIVGINLIAVLAIICLLYLRFGKRLTAPELGPDQNAWLPPPASIPAEEESWPSTPKSDS